MGDADREAGHELANQLSTVLALADLERRRAERAGADGESFATIADCVRKAASSADVLSAASRDLRYLRAAQGESEPLLRELEELCERDGIPLVDPDTARFLSVTVSAMLAGSILELDRKSTRLNSSHPSISYGVICLKKKKQTNQQT